MSRSSNNFGRSAEMLAADWLKQKGYRIVEQNLRIGKGELDLIVQDRRTLVFVEVKARRTDEFGGAPYAVGPRKQRQLIKLALTYLAQRGLTNISCRFDVVLISISQESIPRIIHLENAFEVCSSAWQW
jgi:putative endonuclease